MYNHVLLMIKYILIAKLGSFCCFQAYPPLFEKKESDFVAYNNYNNLWSNFSE